MPSVVEKSCKYASPFTAEVALILLESHDCQHIADVADSAEVSIDRSCRDDVREMAHVAARRVVSEYWLAHGREEARSESVTHLNAVLALFACCRYLSFFFSGYAPKQF